MTAPKHQLYKGTKEGIYFPAAKTDAEGRAILDSAGLQISVDLPAGVFRDELEAIHHRREYERRTDPEVDPEVPAVPMPGPQDDGQPRADRNLYGLSISGGGIRSATFSTGVMQALAGSDLLKYMDYLSTVSGGGYSGSSLTWALYGNAYKNDDEIKAFIDDFGTGPDKFPSGTDDPAQPRKQPPADDKREFYSWRLKLLNYLREHGEYLAPGGGITLLSGLAVLLRGTLLNLVVWVGLVATLLLLILGFDPGVADLGVAAPYVWLAGWLALIVVVGLRGRSFPMGGVAFALAGLAVLVTSQNAETGREVFRCLQPTIWLVLVGAGLCLLYGVFTFFASFSLIGTAKRSYDYRRFIERAANPYCAITVLAFGVGTLGFVADWLQNELGAAGGTGTSIGMVLSGILSGFWTFAKSRDPKPGSEGKESRIPIGLVATVGSLLLLYGGLLASYQLAEWADHAELSQYAWPALVVVVALGFLVNTNYISMGRFYRDRLMETFMPGIDRAIKDVTGPAPEANAARMSAMWDNDRARGPYHIVNTNLVLVDSTRRTWRTRGGDSFILSPHFCGSTATGWRRTKAFERDKMTLATAMAISAAAASPNAGVGGKGLTRSKVVSLLMSLLNLRLGTWVRNCNRERLFPPNHFWPGGAYELSGGYTQDSKWLMLTDGGHFENLALYEMIRRRLKVIVLIDGGADPDFNFADMQNAMRRVDADFGARIDFFHYENEGGDEGNDQSPLHPLRRLSYKRDKEEGYFPLYPGRAERGFAHAKIKYEGWSAKATTAENEPFEGELVYIKTTLVRDLSVTTEGYRDANPTFPDQSTADQFFDPEQFEAYRDLGYRIGKQAAAAIREALGLQSTVE